MSRQMNENEIDLLNEVFADQTILSLYANAHIVHVSPSEILVVLKLGQVAIAKIYLPFSIARDLAQTLGSQLCRFEAAIGRAVLSHDEVCSRLRDWDCPPDPLSGDSPEETA